MSIIFFALMFPINLFSKELQIVFLVISAIGFDFGIQTCLVSHQTIVYGIDLKSRSRLKSILMTGMSVGAWLGGSLYGAYGIIGLASLATGSCILVYILKFLKK